MNQARTTYQSDYNPFDWLQNNFSSDTTEFCSPENVDECLKYISQEFCALGYPSIYSNSNDCLFAANCDIVKLLNATFELLKSTNEQAQSKEDLENRNQRLSSDLSVITKKNNQLKDTIEQTERKLASALERERQLKVKNEQLSNLLKAEKEETKRLTAQIRQQKIAFQHEIRKYENNMNHIKTKLNQLLSDKNPNKKIAHMSTSHALQRNSGQRGKWKTETSTTSAIEDMYNSVISSYEMRCKDLFKERDSYHLFLQSVLLQVLEIVLSFQDETDKSNNTAISEDFFLNEVKRDCLDIQSYEDKFKYLFSLLKQTTSDKMKDRNETLQDEVSLLKSKVSDYEKIIAKYKESPVVAESQKFISNLGVNKENIAKLADVESFEKDKLKLAKEKQILAKSLANVEKEKAELSAQKLAVLKLAMQQKTPKSAWHQGLNTVPAISVITSRDGVTSIPDLNQLKFCTSSSLNQTGQSFSPTSTLEVVADTAHPSKSDSVLLTGGKSLNGINLVQSENVKLDSDLPSWAAKAGESPNIVVGNTQGVLSETSQSEEDLCIQSEPSSEEMQLSRLRAAIKDIEQRRLNIS